MSYFDKVFFQPYAKGEKYEYYQQDPALAKQYVLACEQQLLEHPVCKYGKIGISLLENTQLDLEKALLELLEQHPKAYLYQLLGDLYRKEGKTQEATFYLLKAMGMVNDDAQAYQIKHLLQKTL